MSQEDFDNTLATGRWNAIRTAVERLEEAWQRGDTPELTQFTGEGDQKSDIQLLRALVNVDLEHRWQRDNNARVEYYLERFEGLRDEEHVLLELIGNEYRLRLRAEPALKIDEYFDRFPQLGKALDDLLAQISSDSKATATRDSTLPSGDDTNFFAANSRMSHEPWPSIDGYEFVRVLGRGGMGSVFEARDLKLERSVAIKIPRRGLGEDAESRGRFLREARAAARLRHANICPIYEVGDQGDTPYIAMAFVSGQTLGELARRQPCTARYAAEIVAKVARAVALAHEQGVVHRDIKPDNVLIDEDGEPILTDFGLAKELSGDSDLTHTGQVMGTPAYMAPEQAVGDIEHIGPLSDVYALGAMLYYLVCRRPPFEGNVAEILGALATINPPRPRQLNPSLHRDLETICLKALSKRPQDRYGSAAELADDLERFSAGESILARPDSQAKRLWRQIRKRPVTAAALSVLLILAVAALGMTWRISSKTQRIAAIRSSVSQQIRELERAELGQVRERLLALDDALGDFETLAPAESSIARTDADRALARYIATTARGETLDDSQIPKLKSLVSLLDQRGRHEDAGRLTTQLDNLASGWLQLEPLDNDLQSVLSVLPDQQFQLEGQTIVRSPPDRSREADVLLELPSPSNVRFDVTFAPGWHTNGPIGLMLGAIDTHRRRVSAVTISPDGEWLATGSEVDDVRVWNLGRRRLEHILATGRGVRRLTFSRDSKRLVVDRPAQWSLWAVASGNVIATMRQSSHPSCSPDRMRVASALDRKISVFSTEDGESISDFEYPHDGLRYLILTNDQRVVTMDRAGRVTVWDSITGQQLRSPNGVPDQLVLAHQRYSVGYAYAPEHSLLAVTAESGDVWILGKEGDSHQI